MGDLSVGYTGQCLVSGHSPESQGGSYSAQCPPSAFSELWGKETNLGTPKNALGVTPEVSSPPGPPFEQLWLMGGGRYALGKNESMHLWLFLAITNSLSHPLLTHSAV